MKAPDSGTIAFSRREKASPGPLLAGAQGRAQPSPPGRAKAGAFDGQPRASLADLAGPTCRAAAPPGREGLSKGEIRAPAHRRSGREPPRPRAWAAELAFLDR